MQHGGFAAVFMFVFTVFALLTLAFSAEPCEDKPTTGKYTCADMANKLGLCEKSEHVRALCPKSCNACNSGDETAAATQATTKGSAEAELLKNEHALEISRLVTSHEESTATYKSEIKSLKEQIGQLKSDHDLKVQALNSDHAAVVAEAREAQEKIVAQLEESYNQKEANMKGEFEAKAGEMESNFASKEKERDAKHLKELEGKSAEIKEWRDKFEAAEKNAAVKDDSPEVNEKELKETHAKQIEELKAKHTVEVEGLKTEYELALNSIKDQHAEELAAEKISSGEELKKLKALVAANDEQESSQAGRVAELEAINSEYNTTVKTLQTQLEQLKVQLIAAEASAEPAPSSSTTDDITRLQQAHNQIRDMEDKLKVCKSQKTKLTMVEMQIEQKEEDLGKCKKRLGKSEMELRAFEESKTAATKSLASDLEIKDKALSQCNVNLEKANKDLEAVQSENTSSNQEIIDLKRKLESLTEEHTKCVSKAESMPSSDNLIESTAKIEELQKELDDKQADFDATIIKMQEEHAEAILLAQKRDVEVDADGKVENGLGEQENEIKLTDDTTCQGLMEKVDTLQKGIDACKADLASANAAITETADRSSGNTDHAKDVSENKDADLGTEKARELESTSDQTQCHADLAIALKRVEEQEMKIKEYEADVDTDCRLELLQLREKLQQSEAKSENSSDDNINEEVSNASDAELREKDSGLQKCESSLHNAKKKIEEQALKLMEQDNGSCPPETIKTMETCAVDLKQCHSAMKNLEANVAANANINTSGAIAEETDGGENATATTADKLTVPELQDQLENLNQKLIEDNQKHEEAIEKHRLEVQELKLKLSAKEKIGDASKIADARDLLGGKHNQEKLDLASGLKAYSYGTLALLVICVYSIIPLGKAYPNGCSTLSIIFFWVVLALLCSLVLFSPESIETIQGSPSFLLHYVCGKDLDIVQCVEKSADSSPLITIGVVCLLSLVSFVFVAQLPNFTYYALAFLFVSSAVNGLCATFDGALPGAPMCYSMQSFLNEQTTFALVDICAEGSLAGCRKTASENVMVALAIILIASLFCVALVALYVELVGDMGAGEEAFEPPVIANSIGSDPNGPPIPGQEPPQASMVPKQEATSSNRPSTQQIFAKARAAAQAEITELKEMQAKEIEAIRKQYENTTHSSSTASDKAHEDEIRALKAAYEKQIRDLNDQHLTASGSNNGDFAKLQKQFKQAQSQLEQAFADLQNWEKAYNELQSHNQSQQESFQKQLNEAKTKAEAPKSSSDKTSEQEGRLLDLEKTNKDLADQLRLTKQELESAHATHRQVLGEMQKDYEQSQQSLKFKLGEVVKRFKLLKAQNDNQKQMIHELTVRIKGSIGARMAER